MPETIRTIREDEIATWFETFSYAFHFWQNDPQQMAELRGRYIDLERAFGAFDGDVMVGTYRSFASRLTLPGLARVPVGAVSAVSVRPTHRRRGILTRMINRDLRESAARGEVASILIAAEWPIYGRYGYGPATWHARWTLRVRAASFRQPAVGSIDVINAKAARQLLPELYARVAAAQPGEIDRNEQRWDTELGLVDVPGRPPWRGAVAIHRDAAGEADGFARYHGEEHWEDGIPDNIVVVDDLRGVTLEAELDLWRHLAQMDLTATIKAETRREREPMQWHLADGRAARVTGLSDMLWLRILDVPAMLGSRTYERDGDLVIEVEDALADGPGPAAGRYRLNVRTGSAACERTDAEPDITVAVSSLSAAVLGGTRLADATRAGGATEHRPGALRELDLLLTTADPPWCTTWF
ncbi:MAG TPA: GNAT family N-acetyltransferase [Candidatus Limnocylindrales bacterium]|nr:GNAT family N-acetyltransferase [Candidatus Limnocylindrales bacterium]